MPLPPHRRAVQALYNAPYLLLTLTALLWAMNMVLGRYVAGQVPPVTLALLRWIVATGLLLPFAWGELRRDLPAIRRNLPILLLLSATGISCYNAMSYYALQYTQAVNGLLIQSMAPLMVALWSFMIYRERLSLGQLAGILFSLAGVTLIISQGDLDVLLHLKPNIGDVVIIVALLIYALYASILRERPPLGALSFLATIMGLGALLLIPFSLWEIALGKSLQLNGTTLAVMAYVSIGPSLVAYLFFNRGVELVGANRAAPFLHLMPVFGTALAMLILGERPQWYHFAGYVAVIAGIAMATLAGRSRPPAEPPPT